MDYSKQMNDYKKQSVYSMTQGELLLLLYDELVKRLKRGKLWLEKGNIPEFEKDIRRAAEIIQYLRKILDMKIPISRELARLYSFYEGHTMRILVSRKAEQIDELLPMIEDMRTAFRGADLQCRGVDTAQQAL